MFLVAVLAAIASGPVFALTASDVLTIRTWGKSLVSTGVQAQIGGSVDGSFGGGEVDVVYQAAGAACAATPSADVGRTPDAGAVTPVAAGPSAIETNGFTISLSPRAGSYRLCAWLVQASDGTVDASATTVFTVEADERSAQAPAQGWDPATAACRSLHPAEVVAALGAGRVVSGGGGAQTGNQSPFELANASQCQWDANNGTYLILFIQPESAHATLSRLLHVSGGPALGSRDCPRLHGLGSDACAGGSNLYAVQGRLGLTFTMIGPPGTKPHSPAYTHAEEANLARKIFARVPFARE